MSAVVGVAGFILAGTYPEQDPAGGLESVLQLFSHGEDAGFQVAGIRQRHLERGVSSALPFLAAAAQRTAHIRLETDVVPLGHETPFRLAEDVATVDALSGGRLEAGISTATPHAELLAPLARPAQTEEPDRYALIDRFLLALEGRPLAEEALQTPYGPQIPRVQPHVPGLRDRIWLGGSSERSIRWAADRGLRLLLGNITAGDGSRSFEDTQRAQIDDYLSRFAGSDPAVGVERVIVPVEGASPAQRAHYRAYAESREERTTRPAAIGGRSVLFQRDLIGSADEIVDRLAADPSFDGGTQLRIALPYGFASDEYRQILSAIADTVLPALGWRPRAAEPIAA